MSTTTALDNNPTPTADLPKFRKCTCEGTLPGRACIQCFSTKWLKRCPHCFGSGIIYKNTRQGEPRSEPCINCRRGWQAAMPADLREMRQHPTTEQPQPQPRASVPLVKKNKHRRRAKPQSTAIATPAFVVQSIPRQVDLTAPTESELARSIHNDSLPVSDGAPDSSYQDMN